MLSVRNLIILIGAIALLAIDSYQRCDFFDVQGTSRWTNNFSECDQSDKTSLPNVQLIKGVFCYNNGTGLCKAFAGRFEFYFNTFTDEFLGPVEESEYVDKNGFHKRVPVSYNVDGNILFADRAINWAKRYYGDGKRSFNLLNSSQFNWCQFTVNDNWPYTSSILDANSRNRFRVYFFNRQSCIFDQQTGKRQHYNTRFVYKTKVRIEQEMNPLIFVFEDNQAAESKFRMVKQKRQHWYETKYEVLQKPRQDVDYYLKMDAEETKPCKLCEKDGISTGILSKYSFRKHSKMCLSDIYYERDKTLFNNRLMDNWCGFDEVELADYNVIQMGISPGVVYEADLHNLPKMPRISESFFGVNYGPSNDDWYLVASDGLAFSAMTTIPIPNKKKSVRVIMLWALLKKGSDIHDIYDEHYPLPFIGDYIATYKGKDEWNVDERKTNSKEVRNLNYVDDIAYLHKCDTILLVMGPLYSELPKEKFNLNQENTVLPIDNLGLYEMTNAFFADPTDGSDRLFFYHRTNYVATHSYTCGSEEPGSLVRAKRITKYQSRYGPDAPPIFGQEAIRENKNSEEMFYQRIGVYKGPIDQPEAPNPADFPYTDEEIIAAPGSKTGLLYGMIGSALLVVLIMGIICCLTIRRKRRKNREKEHLSNVATQRSSFNPAGSGSSSSLHAGPTLRSKMNSLPRDRSNSMRSTATTRSKLTSAEPTRSNYLKSNSRLASPTVRSRSLSKRPSIGTTATSGVTNSPGSSRSSEQRSNTPRRSAK